LSLGSEAVLRTLVTNSKTNQLLDEILEKSVPTDLNIVHLRGYSLVMLACESNNPRAVQTLLMAGANPDQSTSDGRNALHVCAKSGSIGCSVLALQFTPDPEILFRQTDDRLNTPLHVACLSGELSFVVHLIRCGCPLDLNENSSGLSPTNLAAFKGHVRVACFVCAMCGYKTADKRDWNSEVSAFWDRYYRSPEMKEAERIAKAILI
jgi:ankyrin repeat protein